MYRFAWTPIITFGTRRLRLLEWVEANLEPTAFIDSPTGDQLGLALSDPRVRMTVTREGARLEDGSASGDGVASLSPALAGIFEILEPRDVVLASASVAWSSDLRQHSYDGARGALAENTSGLGRLGSVFTPVDTSMLLDVEMEDFTGQVEWGIVSAPELRQRVETPRMGRLSAFRGHASLAEESFEDLPRASVFLDSHLHQVEAVPIPDAPGMKSAVQTVTGLSEYLCQQLATDVESKIGEVA